LYAGLAYIAVVMTVHFVQLSPHNKHTIGPVFIGIAIFCVVALALVELGGWLLKRRDASNARRVSATKAAAITVQEAYEQRIEATMALRLSAVKVAPRSAPHPQAPTE
jgi:hypothetical protein